MTYVSFPGLGIEPFHMDRIAFTVFGINVNWYGLIITCGMILAVLLALHHAKIERVKSDDVIDFALYFIIFGVIGARLYYVIMEFDRYLVTDGTFIQNLGKTLYNVIAVWNGGLAIYGGIIAGAITAYVMARIKKIRFPVVADLAGPSIFVGQIIGRWGNFVNVEAFGAETDLPFRMGVLKSVNDGASFYSEMYVHPTFLYESLWNLIGLVLVLLLFKKKKFHGQIFLIYMTWYGFGRMLIEGLRADSLYIGSIRVSQLVGFLTFAAGLAMLILNLYRIKTGKQAPCKRAAVRADGNISSAGEAAAETAEIDDTELEDKTEKIEKEENKDGSSD